MGEHLFGYRKITGFVSQIGECALEMQGGGVVRHGRDAVFFQSLGQTIPIRRQGGVLSIDRGIAGSDHRGLNSRNISQKFSALAHPADLPGRVSYHQCMTRNVSGDHSACADKGILADSVSADNSAIGAQSCAALDQGSTVFMLLSGETNPSHCGKTTATSPLYQPD